MAALLSMSMVACLKTNGDQASEPDNGTGTNNVVELDNTVRPESYTTPFPAYDNGTLTIANDTVGVEVLVDWAGTQYDAPKDITVTLAATPSLVTTYNSDEGTSFAVLDTTSFNYPATLTIPKGQHMVYGRIIVNNASSLNTALTYGIGLTITSSTYGTISGNYYQAIYDFSVGN